jgi:hypothetical protein
MLLVGDGGGVGRRMPHFCARVHHRQHARRVGYIGTHHRRICTLLPLRSDASGVLSPPGGKATKSEYARTVQLPKTQFPMRANAVKNEAQWRERCTKFLYSWQVSLSVVAPAWASPPDKPNLL